MWTWRGSSDSSPMAAPRRSNRFAALYRGDLLAGLAVTERPFEEWLTSERERLHELAIQGLGHLLLHQQQAGAAELAVQTGLRLLALDPLQEPVHRAVMRLYARLGRRDAALRQYQLCVDALQRELRTPPEAETTQLYQELLRARATRPDRAEVSGPARGAAGPGPVADRLSPATAPPPASPPPTNLPAPTSELIGRAAALAEVTELLVVMERALARAKRIEEGWCFAELLRKNGELLLVRAAPTDVANAEECFSEALEWGRRQDALSWELRSATSLARLYHRQGRTPQARKVLAPVYRRFTEGFKTADLLAAKALLDALR